MPPGEPFIRFDWIGNNLDLIGERLLQHVGMTLTAVVIGFAISLAAALFIRRRRRAAAAVIGVTGVLYAIPSLALFAFLIPFTGISFLTAEIALIELHAPDPDPQHPARARSPFRPRSSRPRRAWATPRNQRLWRVELPIAVPIIVAGVRIATVTTVGLVTVTALIGQGGLGYLIVVTGLRGFFPTAIWVGSLLSVALAVLADLGLLGIQARLTPWARARRSAE